MKKVINLIIDFGDRVVIGTVENPIVVNVVVNHGFIHVTSLRLSEALLGFVNYHREYRVFCFFALVVSHKFVPNIAIDLLSDLVLSMLGNNLHMNISLELATFSQKRDWLGKHLIHIVTCMGINALTISISHRRGISNVESIISFHSRTWSKGLLS